MYFLVGKDNIRKLVDYRYQTTEEVVPEPGGEGAKALRVAGITAPYQRYNGFYRRDESADYSAPGLTGQQWLQYAQDGSNYGTLAINADGRWEIGTIHAISNQLATAGWPWSEAITWAALSYTGSMTIAAVDEVNTAAPLQVSGSTTPAAANGIYQPWPKGYEPANTYEQRWKLPNTEYYITKALSTSFWLLCVDPYTGLPASSLFYTSQSGDAAIVPYNVTSGASLSWVYYPASGAAGTLQVVPAATTAALAASGETAAVTVWRQIAGDDMICSASGNYQVGNDSRAVILDKDYPVCCVGADEIGQLWTGENLDVGELGFYYNNDATLGAVYGSLMGADMATVLDYRLRGIAYNPTIDGVITFNSFLPVFQSIGTGDFELELEFELFGEAANGFIFQSSTAGATAVIGCAISTTTLPGTPILYSALLLNDAGSKSFNINYAVGVHTVKISRTAGTVKAVIDGTQWQYAGTAIDLSTATINVPSSSANCMLRSVKLTAGGVTKWAIDGVPLETPSQYTLPSQAHLTALVTLAGGNSIAGRMLKSAGTVSDGGAWADPAPVNFSVDPRTWTEYIDRINQQWNLTHQYKLRVKFYLAEMPTASAYIFAGSVLADVGPVILTIEATRKLRASSSQYWRSADSAFSSVLGSPVLEAGRIYEVEVSTEPTTVRLKILTAGYETNTTDTMSTMAATEKPSVSGIKSNFPGNILELEVTDETAGTIVFSPAHADLYHDEVIGVDRFGFAMLPGGIRSTTFAGVSKLGFLGSQSGFYLRMEYGVSSALSNTNASYWMSVRAIKTRGELVLGGQRIPTVLIGLQSWTAENDRDAQFSTPRSDAALNDIYGPVYTYQQALSRDACLASSGSCWRVPRWDEYQILIDTATGNTLKSRVGWEANPGKNNSGFNALPGGRTAASTYVSQQAMLGSVTPGSADNTWRALALTSSSQTAASGGGDVATGFSIRLVKRFYDVLMPWEQMLRFVKIGSLFIAQKNLDWRGDSIPRNFAISPLIQSRYAQIINDRWDLTHQYRLRAKIKLDEGFDKTKNYNIFAQHFAGNTNGPVGLVWHPEYGLRGVSNQYCRASNQVVVTNTIVNIDAGTYDVEVSTEPTTVRLKVGSFNVIDRDGARLTDSKQTVDNINSNFPGTIDSLTVEDITTGEILFEASKAELYGGLGRYYNDDPALAYLGLYYTFAEHNVIINYLQTQGLPFTTMNTEQWNTLIAYNNGTQTTQGLHLCDPASFTSPAGGMDNAYEMGLLASGRFANSSFVELGVTGFLMARHGLLYAKATGVISRHTTPENLTTEAAPIRLVYAVDQS